MRLCLLCLFQEKKQVHDQLHKKQEYVNMPAIRKLNSDIQKIQKCHNNKNYRNTEKVEKISELIRNLKASRGKEYEQFLEKAKKDFNIGITEKWILTQLRLLLISENVDYKMLHIGKRKNDEEKTFVKNKNESKAIENESEQSIEISEQKSILKRKQCNQTRKKITSKVRFNMHPYIKFF